MKADRSILDAVEYENRSHDSTSRGRRGPGTRPWPRWRC